jgi:hypothetical protein
VDLREMGSDLASSRVVLRSVLLVMDAAIPVEPRDGRERSLELVEA